MSHCCPSVSRWHVLHALYGAPAFCSVSMTSVICMSGSIWLYVIAPVARLSVSSAVHMLLVPDKIRKVCVLPMANADLNAETAHA